MMSFSAFFFIVAVVVCSSSSFSADAASISHKNKALPAGTMDGTVTDDGDPGTPCVFLVEFCSSETAGGSLYFRPEIGDGCSLIIRRNVFTNTHVGILLHTVQRGVAAEAKNIMVVVRDNTFLFQDTSVTKGVFTVGASSWTDVADVQGATAKLQVSGNSFRLERASNGATATSTQRYLEMIGIGGIAQIFPEISIVNNDMVIAESTVAPAETSPKWFAIRFFVNSRKTGAGQLKTINIKNNTVQFRQTSFIGMVYIYPGASCGSAGGCGSNSWALPASTELSITENQIHIRSTTPTSFVGASIIETAGAEAALPWSHGMRVFKLQVKENSIKAETIPATKSLIIIDAQNLTASDSFLIELNEIVSYGTTTATGAVFCIALLGDRTQAELSKPHENNIYSKIGAMQLKANTVRVLSDMAGFVGGLVFTNIAAGFVELTMNTLDVSAKGIDAATTRQQYDNRATVCLACVGVPRRNGESSALRSTQPGTIAQFQRLKLTQNYLNSFFPSPSKSQSTNVARTATALFVNSGMEVSDRVMIEVNTITDTSPVAQPQPNAMQSLADSASFICVYCSSGSAPVSVSRWSAVIFSNAITARDSPNVTLSFLRAPANGRLPGSDDKSKPHMLYKNRIAAPSGAFKIPAGTEVNVETRQLARAFASAGFGFQKVVATGNYSYYVEGEEANSCNRVDINSQGNVYVRGGRVEEALGIAEPGAQGGVYPTADECGVTTTTTTTEAPSTTTTTAPTCTAGQFHDFTSWACQDCPVDTFTNDSDATICSPCPAGETTNGATRQSACVATTTTTTTSSTITVTSTTTTTPAPPPPPSRTHEQTASVSIPLPPPYIPPGMTASEQAAALTATSVTGVVAGALVSPSAAMSVARGTNVFALSGCPARDPGGEKWIEAEINFPESLLPGIGAPVTAADDPAHMHGSYARVAIFSFLALLLLVAIIALAAGYFMFFGLKEGCESLCSNCGWFSLEWWVTLTGVSPVPHLTGLAMSQITGFWLRHVGLLLGSVTTLRFFFLDAVIFGVLPVAVVSWCWFRYFKDFIEIIRTAGLSTLGTATSVVAETLDRRQTRAEKLEEKLWLLQGKELEKQKRLKQKQVELEEEEEKKKQRAKEEEEEEVEKTKTEEQEENAKADSDIEVDAEVHAASDVVDDAAAESAVAEGSAAAAETGTAAAVTIDDDDDDAPDCHAAAEDAAVLPSADAADGPNEEEQKQPQEQEQQKNEEVEVDDDDASKKKKRDKKQKKDKKKKKKKGGDVDDEDAAAGEEQEAATAEAEKHREETSFSAAAAKTEKNKIRLQKTPQEQLDEGLLHVLRMPSHWQTVLIQFMNSRIGRFCLVGDVCWDPGPVPGSRQRVLLSRSPCFIARCWGREKEYTEKQLSNMLSKKQRKKIRKYVVDDVGHFRAVGGIIHQHRFESSAGCCARIGCFEESRLAVAPHSFLISLLLVAVSGFLTGVAQAAPESCPKILYILAVLNTVAFFVTLWLRCFVIPFYNLLSIVMDFVTMVTSLMSMRNSGQGAAVSSSDRAATIQMFISMSLTVSALLLLFVRGFRFACLILTGSIVMPLHVYEKSMYDLLSREKWRREKMREREERFNEKLEAKKNSNSNTTEEGEQQQQQQQQQQQTDGENPSSSPSAHDAGSAAAAAGDDMTAPLLLREVSPGEREKRRADADALGVDDDDEDHSQHEHNRKVSAAAQQEEEENAQMDANATRMNEMVAGSRSGGGDGGSVQLRDWASHFDMIDRGMRATARQQRQGRHLPVDSDDENDVAADNGGGDGDDDDSELEELVRHANGSSSDPHRRAHTYYRKELDLFFDL